MRSIKELNKVADDASVSVRKTVDAIVDSQSFIESDRFVRSQTALGDAVGEGVISGFATVNDVQVGIFAINGEVLKGGIGKANSVKITKCVANAVKTESPVIGIIDTMGARFSEGIEALEGYGAIISAFSSAYGIVPTILVIKGHSYGSLSYLSAMCDFTICYDKSVTATTSPLILVAGTNKDEKSVGTSEAMASSGVASIVVKSDEEASSAIKNLLDLLCDGIVAPADDGNRVCKGLGNGAKAIDIISEVFDANTFVEVKKEFATEVITGFARLNGISVGIVANNAEVNEGRLTADGADKITELLNTCESYALPVINIVDSKGAVNCACCQGKLIRNIGDMLYGYNVISGAKVALVTGNAIGLGYIAFASKSVCDYVIAWENANIGVMDSVSAAELVYADDIAKADDKEKATATLATSYAEENTCAVVVAEKGYVDNVINPNFSRQYLIGAVQAFINKG